MKKLMLFWIVILFCLFCIAADQPSYIYEYRLVSVPVIEEVWTQPYCKTVFNQTTSLNKTQCFPLSVERKYIKWNVVNESTGRVLGVNYGSKEYFGNVHISDDGMVSVWNVPIGQRDFKLFPKCRAYEVEKGVCKVIG